MKTEFLIVFLLVCSVTATTFPEPNEAGETIDEPGALQAIDSTKLHIFDDDGKPVNVNLDEDYPETEEETLQDLENRVRFYLYTKKGDVNKPREIRPNDVGALSESGFDPERQTVFITHGWMNSYKSKACTTVRDAYLEHGDYNIIVVDWGAISHKPYGWASKRVLMVGQYVSKMIEFLETKGMNLSQVTIIGHSLGGHVAGLSGYHVKNEVNYVVALDPALPLFAFKPPGQRVSLEDGKYVEVIHTNGGGLGFLSSLGHVDYYPNGGMKQAGCIVDPGGACSHLRAFLYFAESINTERGFVSARCNSYTEFILGLCKKPTSLMGGAKPDYDVKNRHYLQTNPLPPYARGKL